MRHLLIIAAVAVVALLSTDGHAQAAMEDTQFLLQPASQVALSREISLTFTEHEDAGEGDDDGDAASFGRHAARHASPDDHDEGDDDGDEAAFGRYASSRVALDDHDEGDDDGDETT